MFLQDEKSEVKKFLASLTQFFDFKAKKLTHWGLGIREVKLFASTPELQAIEASFRRAKNAITSATATDSQLNDNIPWIVECVKFYYLLYKYVRTHSILDSEKEPNKKIGEMSHLLHVLFETQLGIVLPIASWDAAVSTPDKDTKIFSNNIKLNDKGDTLWRTAGKDESLLLKTLSNQHPTLQFDTYVLQDIIHNHVAEKVKAQNKDPHNESKEPRYAKEQSKHDAIKNYLEKESQLLAPKQKSLDAVQKQEILLPLIFEQLYLYYCIRKSPDGTGSKLANQMQIAFREQHHLEVPTKPKTFESFCNKIGLTATSEGEQYWLNIGLQTIRNELKSQYQEPQEQPKTSSLFISISKKPPSP